MRAALLLLFTLAGLAITAQDIAGRWVTIDDRSGRERSLIEITVKDGRASGRIADIFDQDKRDARCDKCPGERRDRPVLGMYIFEGLTRSGSEWKGEIFDPESGKYYDCKLWIEDGRLKVRGYLAFFYRTQTWVRERL
jgi:uncharacterized protein (DUF2147 family)